MPMQERAATAVSPPAAAPAALRSAPSAPSVEQLYGECVRGTWPTVKDADTRAAACSKALQPRQLTPDQTALARLTRGMPARRWATGCWRPRITPRR